MRAVENFIRPPRGRRSIGWAIAPLVLALAGAVRSEDEPAPRIIYVNHAAVGANNGESWADAYTDLQDALSDAVAGEEIWVAAGTYRPDRGTGNRYARYDVRSEISLYGSFAGWESCPDERIIADHPTTLDGDSLDNDDPTAVPMSDCCTGPHSAGCDNDACEQLVVAQPKLAVCGSSFWQIYCADTAGDLCGELCRPTRSDNSVVLMSLTGSQEVAIDGFTFVRADGYCPTSDPRCLDQGRGALYADGAGGTVRNCRFLENAAVLGYGSALDSRSTTGLLVERCQFERNGAGLGLADTAIFHGSFVGETIVANCEFQENKGTRLLDLYIGGRIERSVFRGNEGSVGVTFRPAIVRDCLFLNNTHGGLRLSSSVQVANCQFFRNGGRTQSMWHGAGPRSSTA